MWLTVWPGSPLNVGRVIATARSAGLRQLWLRTGSSQNGFYGGPLLKLLVPAAHKAGISVIAWDFPTLSDPAADAARAALAFRMGADAFSPDIESPAEGTYLTARRVRYYLSLVRGIAGARPVIATVPRPDSYWLSVYPYSAEAPFVDAFAPMVYWSCTEPGAAVSEAITVLSRWRPVAPIGQTSTWDLLAVRPACPLPKRYGAFSTSPGEWAPWAPASSTLNRVVRSSCALLLIIPGDGRLRIWGGHQQTVAVVTGPGKAVVPGGPRSNVPHRGRRGVP